MSVDTFPPPVSVLVAALRRAVSLSHCTCPLPTSIRRPLTDEISVVRRSQAAEAAQGSCLRDGMTTDGFLGALWPPVCLRECCCRALPPCVGACAAGSFARRACAMRAKEHGFCVGGVPPSSPPSGVVMGPPPWRLRRCAALTGPRTRAQSASSRARLTARGRSLRARRHCYVHCGARQGCRHARPHAWRRCRHRRSRSRLCARASASPKAPAGAHAALRGSGFGPRVVEFVRVYVRGSP